MQNILRLPRNGFDKIRSTSPSATVYLYTNLTSQYSNSAFAAKLWF